MDLMNGAPSNLTGRHILDAGFVQIGRLDAVTSHTSASEVMMDLPNTEAYAWPFHARRSTEDVSFVRRIRERRPAAKVWIYAEGICTLLGPTHAPIKVRLDQPVSLGAPCCSSTHP